MELRHLRHFIGVAEELHFGRAANRLHIEQSPLSRSIKDLENDLGVKLFERTTRSTKLTHAGEIFLDEARQIVLAIEKARLRINSSCQQLNNKLRIAITDNITQAYATKLIKRCNKEHPDLQTCIFEFSEEQLVASLGSGEIDAGISSINITSSGLTSTRLWSEEIVILIPLNHCLSNKITITLEDIATQPLILLKPVTQNLIKNHITTQPPSFELISNLDVLLLLINTGCGIGIAAKSQTSMLSHSKIRIMSLPPDSPEITTYLITLNQNSDRLATLIQV
ncbi:Hca operon transcriptional activator HcaR [Pseudomonas fluorescens]|uniref:Hca operon transcriptional activator HcaR n=1 Tax=Pseudomonas fluorescens TaxID=294 RepID=A0A5E7QTC6_PSEFL|nr:LysR family transcriptional regulator [Pseudomonas fluorescens]VVP65064.1 Hca operon transcriptional activator HcaR [Pseudomonas fluorescens]